MTESVLIAVFVAVASVAVGIAVRRADRSVWEEALGVARRTGRLSRPHLDERAVLVIGGLVLGAVVAGPLGALGGAPAGFVCARLRSRRRAAREREQLESQLGDAVGAISAALRAGLSLSQAIGYSAGEVGSPLAERLRAAADRIELGTPLDEALEMFADEVGGRDVRLVNGVLSLHRRTGGDLPRVLDQVGITLRERRASIREIRALTAQARLSGAILGFLPIAFFLFLAVTSRKDIEAAFTTPAGLAAMIVGLTMQACAFLWIRNLLRVA